MCVCESERISAPPPVLLASLHQLRTASFATAHSTLDWSPNGAHFHRCSGEIMTKRGEIIGASTVIGSGKEMGARSESDSALFLGGQWT